jgi:sulfite reductase (ferredoxin)
VADLGFYGVSRKMAGFTVPHFQLILGGEWTRNAASYGLPVIAVPAKNIPGVVTRLTERYVSDRKNGERFQDFIQRIGKAELRRMLEDLTKLPDDPNDRSYFSDWGDPRQYGLGDIGIGECAGEVVSAVEFGLAAAERSLFEAHLALDAGQPDLASERAYGAMLQSAQALVKSGNMDISDDPGQIVQEFRERFFDTQLFFDPFAGGKFAQYFIAAHERAGQPRSADSARRLIEEAQLFIEASHSCYQRISIPVTVA